ncbi:hypothetical protein ACQX31_11370 [Corynebacterium diphtheriae]
MKFRERWRPFCPSMLDTVAPQMIKVDHPAPFMPPWVLRPMCPMPVGCR